ncbi:MAG: hypothetical protein OEU26_11230, partial [Candidatus Tectomicrobia bacterium]|nr:hypothetical protein [Candidatus Tectomicrobia bacterium]
KWGVHRYLWGLIHALKRIDNNNEYVILFGFWRRSGLATYYATRDSLSDASDFRAKMVETMRYISLGSSDTD